MHVSAYGTHFTDIIIYSNLSASCVINKDNNFKILMDMFGE